MRNYLLIIFILTYINCLTELKGNFKLDYYFTSYITPENNLLYFEPTNQFLYKSSVIANSSQYKEPTKLSPRTISKDIVIGSLYFNFIYLNSSSIKVSYFNEKYLGSFLQPLTSEHFSIEEIGNDKFVIFLNNNKTGFNNTINIANFNATANDEAKFEIKKTYVLEDGIKDKLLLYINK